MIKNNTLTKLMITVVAVSTLCACGKQPAVVVDETQEIVEDPEVVEEIEVVEPVEEEKTEPAIVLIDDNGNYYVPQHVTLEDFYAKVEECEKGRYFSTDWDRDRASDPDRVSN